MGNSQSSLTKNETRRANRLTKPLTRKLALSSPQLGCLEANAPELASGLIGWQNPWVGSQLSTEVRHSEPKPSQAPPTLLRSGPKSPEQNAIQNPIQPPDDLEFKPITLRSGTVSASPSIRRASYQPGTSGSYSHSSMVEQPRRANSMQTPSSHRHSSVIYGDVFDNATTSNTAFLVDNQRFSLTRRRSLLTRPGVATRRTTSAFRRVPSPIGEPEVSFDDSMEPQGLQWPLQAARQPSLPMPPPARPSSPVDPRYTQLGALKLGSLRVVNGAASPCPSERLPLDASGAGLGLDNIEGLAPNQSTLEIPSVSDLKKEDDAPDSPFSYEKSPVMTVPLRTKSMFMGDSEDEGIAMCDEGFVQLDGSAMGTEMVRKTSGSLNKSDSGYSSANSVRSLRQDRARTSFDSQASGSCGADSTRNSRASRDPSRTRRVDHLQRHGSLQRINSVNFSQRNPSLSRWHDRGSPPANPHAESRHRRSTPCTPHHMEYFLEDCVPNQPQSIPVAVPRTSIRGQPLSTRASLRDDRFSMTAVDASPFPPSSATLDKRFSYHQGMATSTKPSTQRSTSEHRGRRGQAMLEHHTRPRNMHSNRAWSHRSGIEVPPLPTIVSPGPLNAWEEKEMEFPVVDSRRGRPRSRSQNHRSHKLTKSRPQSEVFI